MELAPNHSSRTVLDKRVQTPSSLVEGWFIRETVSIIHCPSERYRTTRPFRPPRRWQQCDRKKGGEGLGYSGHKHQKGLKELVIVDNNGFVIAPLVIAPVNRHDAVLLPESVRLFRGFADRTGIPIHGSKITFDSGFDGQENKQVIKKAGLVPVIRPNRRNTKTPIAIARLYRWFDRLTYKLRFCVERCFAWQDVYRRLVICYERLAATRRGFRCLAYAMINYRNSV